MEGLPPRSCRNWEAALFNYRPLTALKAGGTQRLGQNIGLRFWESLIEGGWVRVYPPPPKLWKTGTMRFCLDWRLCRFASVSIVPQGFFSWALAGYKFRHILSHSCVCEAHIGSHAGNLMNMFSCLGVSQKPTDQRRGECYKVSDSQGPVADPVHVFGHRKD